MVEGNPATEAFGTQPYNREIIRPALRAHAPGWAPDHLTSVDLAARLSLTVNRASVVTGEAVYLKIDGLTDEEAATWGFLWEFDTAGEFQHLSELPWHMRQKNRATGHHQMAAWDMPGTKTVKVRIVPPVWSGIKGAVLTVAVENRDPEAEFAGKTWAVTNNGAVTDVPAGARAVATFQEARAAANTAAGGRILLRRGQVYDSGITNNMDNRIATVSGFGVMMDAWGPETDAKPIVTVLGPTGFQILRATANAEFLLAKDIRFKGSYDPATGLGKANTLFATAENIHLTLHGCESAKNRFTIETQVNSAPSTGSMSLYDCDVTDWENYGIYSGSCDTVMIRGSAMHQSPLAVAGGPEIKNLDRSPEPENYPDHGPLRIAHAKTLVFSQVRGFSCNGWSAGGPSRYPGDPQIYKHQTIIRCGANGAENCNVLVAECYVEGGWAFDAGVGPQGSACSGLIAMHGNYTLATANSGALVLGHSGFWCRDNVFVFPDVLQEGTNVADFVAFGSNSGSVSDTWATKNFSILNNTIAYMISKANQKDGANVPSYDALMRPAMAFKSFTPTVSPAYVYANNLFWAPNITLAGEAAPRVPEGIYSAGSFGPRPLYQGKRQALADGRIIFRPEHATPADAAILPLLSKDSALCGTADRSLAGAIDFFGRLRGANPTVGSVERNLSDALDPILDPYALADRHPQLLGAAQDTGYGLSLGRYLLARVAAGALGVARDASRTGRSVLYNTGQGHPDTMAIGAVNRIRSLTDYTGFPLLCGAKFQDGGFDPFIEVDVEPGFDTGVTYDSLFAHPRIGDPRFLLDAAIDTGLMISGAKTHRLHFGGLRPGDRMKLSCVGITTSTGLRRGDLVLTAGATTLTGVLDAASDAASNMAAFAPVTVPESGRISLSITPQKEATNAFLSSVLLDFV